MRGTDDPEEMSGTRTGGPAAEGGDAEWMIGCECGYVARGGDAAALVADARRHALEEHRLDLSADQILRGARPPDEPGGGRVQG